ncbi:MAG: hypothetical protein FWC98_02430, partial [Bacteroidales bacterium]|nr:hypothetical protein [Bacteroidales bacterium]
MKTSLRFVIGLLLAASTLSATWAQPVATVRLGTVQGCPGQIVEIPLYISGIENYGLDNFHFTIPLDTNILDAIILPYPIQNQGFPHITYFNEEFLQRGNFSANVRGNEIMITWIDRSADRLPTLQLEGENILFKLNVRIKEMPIEPTPVEIRLATLFYLSDQRRMPYQIHRIPGSVLAAAIPDVRIDRSTFDNPFINAWGRETSDFTMCVYHSWQFQASGAERYAWEIINIPFIGTIPQIVLDRADVPNPVFTPKSWDYFGQNHNIWAQPNTYTFVVRGYNSDGCFGTDTIIVMIDYSIRSPLVEQPNHVIVNRGETIDLAIDLLPRDTIFGVNPQVFRWFPEGMVENPRSSTTRSEPIYEPTWFWAEIRQLPFNTPEDRIPNTIHGCVQLLNIRVDILEDMFDGRIVAKNPENLEEYSYFCGIPGQTEHRATLAALIQGGLGKKTYTWNLTPLYDGPEPELLNFSPDSASMEIIFFGTTAVSVRILDSITLQDITLYDTLFVEEQRTMAVHIAMDEISQRQYELGFCPGMPLTLTATVENAGLHYQIFWEEVREGGHAYRRPDLTGSTVTIPRIRENATYRAVLNSAERCVTAAYVFSNEIDPKSKPWETIAIWMNTVANPTCNTDSVDLRFTVVNMGTNPFFEIFRNDELIDEFTHTGTNSIIEHRVKSFNYWDRFNVRFTNTSGQCVQANNRFSINYATPNFRTNETIQVTRIVSLLGENDICDTPDGMQTFRLEGMEQFGKNTTVIWMINDEEWGRYEFDPNLANSEGLSDRHFIINEDLEIDEEHAFASGFAFHFNIEGFPTIGKDFSLGYTLSAIVITQAMCGSQEGQTIMHHVDEIVPKFVSIQDAVLTITPDNDFNVCKGDKLTFSATLQHANINIGAMRWFLNGQRVGEGSTFTLENALNNDTIVAIFESRFACARNLPLRETRIVTAHDLPKLVVRDTLICNGDDVQLFVETDAVSFLWTGENLNNATIQNPIATPSGLNTTQNYTVTVTDERGCQSTATLTIRMAERVEVTANIWLGDLADTIICWDKLVLIQSEFSPAQTTNFERVWLRNGFATHNTGEELLTSTIRNGDVWQLQVTLPTLNTCLPRTAVSNAIEFRVDSPVQTRILASKTTLCPGDSIQLSVIGGAHHRWTSDYLAFVERADEAFFVSPTQTTRFFVQAFGPQSLCFSKDTITIFVEEYHPVNLTIELDSRFHQNNCANVENRYAFVATPTSPGTLPRFDWYVNDVQVAFAYGVLTTVRDLQPGDEVHAVMTADVVSCQSNVATSNRIVILENPNTPIVDGKKKICEDEFTTLTIQNPQENVTYRWFSSADNFEQVIETGLILNNTPPAIYRVVAVAENGCEISEIIEILTEAYYPVNLTLQLDPRYHQNNCMTADNNYLFVALPTNPGISPTISWYVNDVQISTAGSLTFGSQLQPGDEVHVMMTADVVSCRSNVATSNRIVILENPNTPIIDGPKIICPNELATLTVQNLQNNVTYLWYSSVDNFKQVIELGPTLNDKPAATYLVVAVAENGCESSETITVEEGISPQARISLITPVTEIQTREIVEFRNRGTYWVRAFWTFGNEPEEENNNDIVQHMFTSIQTYPIVLRLESEDGCEATYKMNINVLPGFSGVFVPSAFMPSSPDPNNQVLRVFSVEEIRPNGFR